MLPRDIFCGRRRFFLSDSWSGDSTSGFTKPTLPSPLIILFMSGALIASRALWFYAEKLLWPMNLAVIYPRWEIDVADPLGWGYLAAAAAVAATLWIMRRRIGRGPLACALFFAVTLSPTLGLVDYSYMGHSFVADRFQYLAGIGVIILFAAATTRMADRLAPSAYKMARGPPSRSYLALRRRLESDRRLQKRALPV